MLHFERAGALPSISIRESSTLAFLWAATGALIVGCGGTASNEAGSDSSTSSAGSEGGGASDADADAPGALNPSMAPGGNFDLSAWELQLPIGSPGDPTTIAPSALEGPNGFQDTYFYTDKTDGAMAFFDPENGVTTANSDHPRSELREMNTDATEANWPIAGTNTLSATLAVTHVADHVCVGQIHVGSALDAGLAASTKPLLQLYYYATGDIKVGIESAPNGGSESPFHSIATVPLGTQFNYVIQLTGAFEITLTLNDTPSTFAMPHSFEGYGMYFKAGDYDQTADADAGATVGAAVKFYALRVSH